MTEQERAELECLKAALRQVNENSGYGSDATFTTRLVFRTAVLRYWHADRDGAVYRLFETFAELDGGTELTRLRCSSAGEQRQSRGGTVSPRNMMLRTGRRSIR